MKMLTIALGFVCFVSVTRANIWTSPFDSRSHWAQVRRSLSGESNNCKIGGGKCYSTVQCCKGFVCAEFDDYVGELSYAVPGFCVREKDLEPCVTNDDCALGTRCIFLGRTANQYCVPVPVPEKPKSKQSNKQIYTTGSKGGLGSQCNNDSDCKVYTSDGESKLCCQQVKRGRLGWRKMCDRVSEVSRCIVSRK